MAEKSVIQVMEKTGPGMVKARPRTVKTRLIWQCWTGAAKAESIRPSAEKKVKGKEGAKSWFEGVEKLVN